MKNLSYCSRVLSATALLVFGLASAAFGQLQWSSYDTSGNLVTANVATGGDLTSGSIVTFTIPANTQLFFVTKNFTPVSLAGAGSRMPVTFKVSASAGLSGILQRTMGWGLFNSANTAGFTDDVGYFGLWNGAGTPVIETYDHPSGTANLFGILPSSSNKLGQGTVANGTLADGVTYTNLVQLIMKADLSGIQLGSSSGTLAAAGLAINGPGGVAHRVFTNPVSPLLGGTSLLDEFAFMFNNTTANPVTVTLSAIGLGNSLTWDASGANPTVPTDGSGNWSTTNANWSGGAGGAIGASDSVWSSGYSAVIGANTGTPGTITITEPAGVTVSNITFNTNYTVSGNALTLTGTPTITVAASSTATNTEILAGTGFTKAGNGTLRLAGSVANTYSGLVTINAGTLTAASSSTNIVGDLLVNPNGTFLYSQNSMIALTSTLIVNGGLVTNITASTVLIVNKLVLDNNGLLSDGSGSAYVNATNYDLRSGNIYSSRYRIGGMNTFKSTAGTVIITNRPNASATDGHIVTMNAGTLIFDKSSQTAARLLANGGLTLGGGLLIFSNGVVANSPSTENPGTGGTLINSGASSILFTNVGGGGNATFGVVTRKIGGTLNFFKNGTGTQTTTSANVNGIQGGWATWNTSDWLAGTTFAAYAAYTTTTDPTTWAAANNVTLSVSPSPNVPTTAINSLKLTGASTVTLTGTLTLSSGGLLVTGTGANSITGGTLLGASGTDLIVHQYSTGDLTISSTLADNGVATSLTKSGTGKLIITGTDSMTGTNYLNGGTVEVSNLAELAAGPLFMNAGTLRYTGLDTSSARTITLNGLGGTFDIAPGVTVTQNGVIDGSGAAIGDLGGITKIGNGKLILTTSNYFNGFTVVSNGVLSINGTNAYDKTTFNAGNVTVYGGTLGGNGLIAGSVDIKSGGTISPGNSIGTLTLATNLTLESGSTNLFEVTNNAAGDLLVVQGNLTIQTNSTIAINVLGTAFEPTTNTLITYAGAKSGSFNPTVIVNGLLDSSVTIDESTLGQIKLVAIPQVAITSQPQDATVSTNDPVTFSVSATGSAPIGYQWYFSTNLVNPPVPISGAAGPSYFIVSADGTNNGLYSVVVSNSFNSVTSRFAVLIVGDIIPQISGPTNMTVIAGNSVTFSTAVILANPAPTFQWQTNGANVSGATGSSFTLNNVPTSFDGLPVSVIASNAGGSATNSATLSVIVTPAITPQPSNLTVNVGDTAVFTSGASGVPIPTLQWYKNNVAISGQTGVTLTIANAQGVNIANYKLIASNIAGSATSSVVTLTVNSTTLASTAFTPTNGATAIGYDTPLYVTFNGPISIVNSGRIRIYDSTNSTTPVDTIDMSSNTVVISPSINLVNNIQPHSLFSGDSQVINYFPVIISGNTAAIYPHGGVMTSNQTYYVTMDNGVVADGTGAYFAGISDTNAWRFTTKPTGPANPTNLIVAADNSGDFVTVQGAVDSILPGNTNFTMINIRNGVYTEIVNVSGKNNITFRGQSRTGTVVGYPNNNNLTGTTAGRMAIKANSSDLKFENLTLTNGTPQGGSQAETLLVYNNGLRCVVDNCDIVSRQDTVLINANTSQAYFNNCRIIGNFDYIWGVGVGYFNNCVFHTITNTLSGSYNLTAARTQTASTLSATTPWVNPNGTTFSAYGFTFVDCTIEADSGVTGITMAGSNGTAGGLDSWINCLIDTNAYVNPLSTLPPSSYVLWQYNNTNITGANFISFSSLTTIGVTNNDPRLLAATNPVIWFSGWVPLLPNTSPVFTAPPTGTNIIINVGFNLSVTCTATDSDTPAQTLTYSLLPGAPSGAAVDPNTGIFTWRPPVASAGTSNNITVVATDNGTPNLSAMNTFAVIVNPVAQPTASSATYSNGQFSLTINGTTGPDYIVQTSTDLISWQNLFTNSSPALPFTFTDTNAVNVPVQFYRILLGP